MGASVRSAVRPRDSRGFAPFWIASTVSDFGTYITLLALQVLLVKNLHASALGVGLVNAARWVPYLLFGLLAGVYVERRRRLPLLVATDIGRAVFLGMIPLLAAVGGLSVPVVIALMFPFGLFSVVNDAADMSFLPRLLPPAALEAGNVRLQQSMSAAQTTGPLVGGGLVGLVRAPMALVVDAVSYLFSGLLLATIRVDEPAVPVERRHVLTEIREGMAWVYRHPKLAPMALTGHGWFVFNSMMTTVYAPFVINQAGLNPFEMGVAGAGAGVGGVIGGTVSARLGRWLGLGPAVVVAQFLFPVAFVFVVLAPRGVTAVVMITVGMVFFGLAIGLGSPLENTYRQAVTPDRLRSRMIATMRSFNWGMYAIGGPLGGLIAKTVGNRAALWAGIAGVTAMAVWLLCSRFRTASLADS